MKMFDMTGKVVIVTGGSGGIGYEAARALAEAGANVGLHSVFFLFHYYHDLLDLTTCPGCSLVQSRYKYRRSCGHD